MMDQKKCLLCLELKDLDLFSLKSPKNRKSYILSWCKECVIIWKHNYYLKNKEEITKKNLAYVKNNKPKIQTRLKNYYRNNKSDLIEYQKKYYKENINSKLEYAKIYRNKNDIVIKKSLYYKRYRRKNLKKLSEYIKKYFVLNKKSLNEKACLRKKTDINFKLRTKFSSRISCELRKSGISKRNNSYLNNIGYSIQQLKCHLENLFESWMNWNNYGKYNKSTWIDNDQSTWTWNIDHIIPHSDLPYRSMSDENFKKCWALSNLRPLSAKQNILDGVLRVRHIKNY